MFHFRAHLCAILMVIALTAAARCADAEGSFRIVQISDTHIGNAGEHVRPLKTIVREINALPIKPDFVLSTGDYANTGAAVEYKTYTKLISKFTMPVYHAIGNHEVKWSSWGKAASQHFLHQQRYYSFDHKGIHFVSIDSTIWLEHASFIDPQELEWLAQDLKKTGTSMPVILFYHHCPNYVMNEPALLDVLQPYNVKMALVGHEHAWGTYVRNGIYFQLDHAAYEGVGNYRILDFDSSEIRSYRKEIGKDPVADGVIKLAPVSNPVQLTSPQHNSHQSGAFDVVAKSSAPMKKMEMAVDGKYVNASKLDDGCYKATLGAEIVPGRHIVSVRGTDSTGGEWLQYASMTSGDMGRELWRFTAEDAIQRTVTVRDGRAYFGCIGGSVYCLDAATGRPIWNMNAGADVLSQIAVDNGVAFFGVTDGSFMAVSADTGKKIWSTKLGDMPVLGSPVVNNGVIYTSGGDNFHALNASDGKKLWSTPIGGMTQVTPLVCNDKIYFGSWDYFFYCLDAKTGKPDWKNEIGQWLGLSPASSNPAAYNNTVLFTAYPYTKTQPDIFCADMRTGKYIWTYQTAPEENGCGECSPCVIGNSVFVNMINGNLVKISAADGKELWRSPIGQSTYATSPIEANGKVFSCGIGGLLRAFDENTGKSRILVRIGFQRLRSA